MDNSNHSHLHAQLTDFLQQHTTVSDRIPARHVLVWLSVCRRPLRASELWLALQLGDCEDCERIRRLLTESTRVSDHEAASSLRDLLGGLITLTEDTLDRRKVHVALCNDELGFYLTHFGGIAPRLDPVLSLTFSIAQAHVVVAKACMAICSVTTLDLAYIHHDTGVASLILYAWSNWNVHLRLSGCSPADDDIAVLVDFMLYRVSSDTLVLLLSLSDFITGPLTFPSTMNRLGCIADILRVQGALEQPMLLLPAVVRHKIYAESVENKRRTFGVAHITAPTGRSDIRGESRFDDTKPTFDGEATPIGTQTFDIKQMFAAAVDHSRTPEWQMVRRLAEVARGLRTIHVAVVSAPALYYRILHTNGPDRSPMEILVNTANIMETVADYLYWRTTPDGPSIFHMLIPHIGDESYDAVMHDLKADEILPRDKRYSARLSNETSLAGLPAGATKARWRMAVMIDRMVNRRSSTVPGSTFTINNTRPIVSPSSFASFPPQMYSRRTSLRFLHPIIPNSLRRFYRNLVPPLLQGTASTNKVRSTDPPGPVHTWPLLKSALLADGYQAAALYIGIGILLNHVRRILFPWLGTYMFYNPMEDLRLVRARPDVFLNQAFAFSWSWVVFSYAQKRVCDILGRFLMDALLVNSGVVTAKVSGLPDRRHVPERTLQAFKVCYVLWALAALDFIFARSVNTFSFVTAFQQLLSGGTAERTALSHILEIHRLKLPLIGVQVVGYITTGLLPMAYISVQCALTGRPGLLLVSVAVAAGASATIRFRSRLYIALELSSMFVALGFAIVAAMLLAAEFAADPLGLAAATAAVRRRTARVRGVVPHGAAAIISNPAGPRWPVPRGRVDPKEIGRVAGTSLRTNQQKRRES